ncbi:MAG: hypothetical protein Q9179_002632 [Wetmoreana sp. 5 TL-2023]
MNSSPYHQPASSVNSADVESHHGTPETKLTVLSPEDMHANMGGTPQIASRSNNPPAFLLGAIPMKENPKGKAPNPVPAGYQDPFVTPKPGSTSASSSEVPKLSPVAPTFTPLRLISNTSEGILSNTLKVPGTSSPGAIMYTPSSQPSASVIPETRCGEISLERYHSSVTSGTHLSRSSQTSSSSFHSPGAMRQLTRSGHFSSDSPISRSLMISQIDQRTPFTELESLLCSTKYRSRLHLVVENLPVTGIVYVSFTDVRDAIEVVSALRNFRGEWLVQYLPVPSYALNPQEGSSKGISASLFEGQLLVKADFSGPAVYFDTDTVGRLILDLLNNYGVIMAYEAVVAAHPVVAYRAEFYDTKDADHAMDVRHLAIRCKHLATAPLFHQAFRRLACRRLLGTGSMLLRSGQVQWAKYNIVRYCLPGATVTIQGASSDTEDVIFKITQVGTTT